MAKGSPVAGASYIVRCCARRPGKPRDHPFPGGGALMKNRRALMQAARVAGGEAAARGRRPRRRF